MIPALRLRRSASVWIICVGKVSIFAVDWLKIHSGIILSINHAALRAHPLLGQLLLPDKKKSEYFRVVSLRDELQELNTGSR